MKINMQEILEKVRRELKIRYYSQKTIKTYVFCIAEYLRYKKVNYRNLDEENIKSYLLQLKDGGKSSQTINLHLNSIKYLYRDVFKNLKKLILNLPKEHKNYRLFYRVLRLIKYLTQSKTKSTD